MLLKFLDEGWLGETRLWLSLMRYRLHRCHRPLRALREIRELCFGVFIFVVLPFQVDGGESGFKGARGVCLESILTNTPEECGGCREFVRHLRCDCAAPDQRVDLQLAVVEIGGNLFWCSMEARGTNRLMRLLRVLRL